MLALDESNENDIVEQQGNYTFCISKELAEQLKSVKIDFTYMGFSVESEVPLAGAGAGASCSSGGCSGCSHS